MAATLASEITISVTGRHETVLKLGKVALPFSLSSDIVLATGVGLGQSDRVFQDERTLAPSANESLDLVGVLLDVFGAAITFVTLKAIIVKASPLNTNDVIVSRPASGVPLFNTSLDAINVKPGGTFAWFESGVGIPVTASTAHLLNFANSSSGTSVIYDIVLIGTSA